MRRITAFIGAVTIAAFLVPAQSALAVHEDDCLAAFNSGDYNVIIAPGPGTITPGTDITGTSGDDLIIGTDGNDRINALSGDDVVCGRGQNDVIDGGSGSDNLIGDVCDGCEGLVDDEGNVAGPTGTPGSDRIFGASGSDLVYGDDGDDPQLSGGSGSDEIRGGNNADNLTGESGNDLLDGMGGAPDNCVGGSGSDTIANCEGGDANTP